MTEGPPRRGRAPAERRAAAHRRRARGGAVRLLLLEAHPRGLAQGRLHRRLTFVGLRLSSLPAPAPSPRPTRGARADPDLPGPRGRPLRRCRRAAARDRRRARRRAGPAPPRAGRGLPRRPRGVARDVGRDVVTLGAALLARGAVDFGVARWFAGGALVGAAGGVQVAHLEGIERWASRSSALSF